MKAASGMRSSTAVGGRAGDGFRAPVQGSISPLPYAYWGARQPASGRVDLQLLVVVVTASLSGALTGNTKRVVNT